MKEIETASHEDLVELRRLAREIVKMHVKYIKKGFQIIQIATTFGRIYYIELLLQLDQEAMKVINRSLIAERENGNIDTTPSSRRAIASHICLRMSSALIRAITFIKDKPSKTNPSK